MFGSDVQKFHRKIIVMKLIFQNQMVYWCESNTIFGVRYDGSDKKLLFRETQSSPAGLVVYDDSLYWIDT